MIVNGIIDHSYDNLNPLSIASKMGNFFLLNYLIGKGYESRKTAFFKHTDLEFATLSRNISCINLLCKNDSDPNDKSLLYAIENDDQKAVDCLISFGADVNILIQRDCLLNVWIKNVEILKKIIKNAREVCENVHVDGDIHAIERLELGAQARVKGNLHYGLIETAMGAQIEGRLCPMTEASPRPLELPASVETVD